MSKNWFDLLAASILGLIITFLLVHFLNNHIDKKPAAVNINTYQFAVVNFDSLKEDKSNTSPRLSFVPEIAAQRLVDNNDKQITSFEVIYLIILWVLWLFFNKLLKRLIDCCYAYFVSCN